MKDWHSQWDDFLNERIDKVELSSSGNVSAWLDQRWEAVEDSTKEDLKKEIEALVASEMGETFTNYASGKDTSSETEDALKDEAVDIIDSLGLSGVLGLPGGAVALKFISTAAKKLGVALPAGEPEDDEAAMNMGGMSFGEYYLATYTQRV